MSQSILYSLSEQIVNTIIGLIIGILFLIVIINPLFGLTLTVSSSIEVSVFMFIVSIMRGFLLRRIFYSLHTQQTFKHSIVEKLIDVGLGFIIATIVWSYVMMPSYSQVTTLTQDIVINALFFVINFIRSMAVRRFFESRIKISLTSGPKSV